MIKPAIPMVNEISYETLQQWQQTDKPFVLVDVREEHEREVFHIGGRHIPMEDVFSEVDSLDRAVPVVVYCRKGVRSAIVIQRLQDRFGFQNLYNLKGGIYNLQP